MAATDALSKLTTKSNADKHQEKSPSPPRFQRTAAFEPSSFLDLFAHSRKQLYVRPLHWREEHLQLLNCKFARKTVADEAARHTTPRVARVAKAAATNLKRHGKFRETAFHKLLSLYDIKHVCPGPLSLGFDGRAVAKFKVEGIFVYAPDSSVSCTSFVWLDRTEIPQLRENTLRGRNQYMDGSRYLTRRQQKRLDEIRPHTPTEDPYFAAILIALAQKQRQDIANQTNSQTRDDTMSGSVESDVGQATAGSEQLKNSNPNNARGPKFFKVHVLASVGYRIHTMQIYSALIPVELLDRFDTPSRHFPSSLVEISYYSIFMAPEETLGDRLETLISLICPEFSRQPDAADDVIASKATDNHDSTNND